MKEIRWLFVSSHHKISCLNLTYGKCVGRRNMKSKSIKNGSHPNSVLGQETNRYIGKALWTNILGHKGTKISKFVEFSHGWQILDSRNVE